MNLSLHIYIPCANILYRYDFASPPPSPPAIDIESQQLAPVEGATDQGRLSAFVEYMCSFIIGERFCVILPYLIMLTIILGVCFGYALGSSRVSPTCVLYP